MVSWHKRAQNVHTFLMLPVFWVRVYLMLMLAENGLAGRQEVFATVVLQIAKHTLKVITDWYRRDH